MRVYFDNCVLNRPFDDQAQERIRLESEAVIELRKQIVQGKLDLVWSYLIDYENLKNALSERRQGVDLWKILHLSKSGPQLRLIQPL